MNHILKKVDNTLLELWIGILVWNICSALLSVWFVPDKANWLLGLAAGCLLAVGAAFHMWWALDRGLDDAGSAQGYVRRHSLIRYGVIILVMGIVMVTRFANPLAAFLGLMGLKAGAYMQPFIHSRLHGTQETYTAAGEPEDVSADMVNDNSKEVNL